MIFLSPNIMAAQWSSNRSCSGMNLALQSFTDQPACICFTFASGDGFAVEIVDVH